MSGERTNCVAYPSASAIQFQPLTPCVQCMRSACIAPCPCLRITPQASSLRGGHPPNLLPLPSFPFASLRFSPSQSTHPNKSHRDLTSGVSGTLRVQCGSGGLLVPITRRRCGQCRATRHRQTTRTHENTTTRTNAPTHHTQIYFIQYCTYGRFRKLVAKFRSLW